VDESLERRWEAFLSVRQDVMKALEQQRAANIIGSPLEARVTVATPDAALRRMLQEHHRTLAEAFIVSEFRAVDGTGVTVERAPGGKCQRCWKYTNTIGTDPAHPALCDRCAAVVTTG
jgi:isoleucyl-tRNA synthetase